MRQKEERGEFSKKSTFSLGHKQPQGPMEIFMELTLQFKEKLDPLIDQYIEIVEKSTSNWFFCK